jgi:hypothetical protein
LYTAQVFDLAEAMFALQPPFLLQTPACGPRENYCPEPPYFRFIEIDEEGKVLSAKVLALNKDGKDGEAVEPKLSVSSSNEEEKA